MQRLRKAVIIMLLVCVSSAPFTAQAAFDRNLAVGSSGPDVSELQQLLKDKGFYTYPAITGYFGPFTSNAVADFQRSVGIDPLGIVGPATRAVLNGLGTSAPATLASLAERLRSLVLMLQDILKVAPTGVYDQDTVDALDAYTADQDQDDEDPPRTTGRRHGGGGDDDDDTDGTADTAGPVISAVSAGTPADTTATITWTTDEDADSQVEYGVTTAYGSNTALDAALETSHGVGLAGLSPSTTYHYRVRSADGSGNVSYSSDQTFTTSATADTTAPVRSGGSPSGTLALNTTSTTISLTTDEAATCKYSTSSGTAYGSMTAFDTTGGTSHSSSISGLSNGGSYVYYVKCQDAATNTNSTDYSISFTVAADTTSPTVSLDTPLNNATVSGSSVSLTATASDDVSVSGVQFKLDTNTTIGTEDTTPAYGVTWDSTGVADGSHTLVAVARDGTGNYATSSVATVTVDNTGPAISSISVSTTTTSATITWTTNEPGSSSVEYGLTSSYGTASTSATLATSHTIILTGLSEGTIYHYRVASADGSGNASSSTDRTFTTATGIATLSVPSGFGWTPSFQLYRQGTTYSTNFDIDARKPAYTQTIYVGAGGNNANDGLTYANRVRSIKIGISKANAFTGETVRLLIDPGEYRQSVVVSSNPDSWGAFNPTVSLVVEVNGAGRVYNIQDVAMPAFVASSDANIYKSTYTTQSPGRSVIDKANLGADGRPTRLWRVNTVGDITNPVSELNAAYAAHGSAMYLDTTNKVLWVRLPDNRAPDANMLVLGVGGGVFNSASANRTLWMENISFWGGSRPFTVTSGSTATPTVYGKSIDYLYAASNDGFGWTGGGGAVYHVNSYAAWNDRDGFNYHGSSGVASPTVLEVGSTGDWNGFDDAGTNNGSTVHEETAIIRLNGLYRNNADRNIADIQNARSWNLGVTGGPSRASGTEASANFASGNVGVTEATKMWLDGAVSAAASTYDLEAYAGDTIYTANMSTSGFTNVTTGTITTYTP